jgi:Mg/Co/Ni transporter MgtE
MTREQIRAAWIISTLMVFELLGLWSLAYFARLPYFFFIFLRALRILSPLFLWLYAIIFIAVMFGRGQEFTWLSWKEYLKETFRFFILSLSITLVILVLSSFSGVIIWFVLKRLNALPAINNWMDAIKIWVATQFY